MHIDWNLHGDIVNLMHLKTKTNQCTAMEEKISKRIKTLKIMLKNFKQLKKQQLELISNLLRIRFFLPFHVQIVD